MYQDKSNTLTGKDLLFQEKCGSRFRRCRDSITLKEIGEILNGVSVFV